ncbi:hypothetical protein [Niveispirillum fermenti]|uniref:hypothetical protein n=1 Tax=Niveispirillum fermenti TaxID=1233113 RepID=UPI003A856A6B
MLSGVHNGGGCGMEWNDPGDMALITRIFRAWAEAVLAKDGDRVESFHDEGFKVRIGERLFDKRAHIAIELAVDSREMRLVAIDAVRRVGDLLLVWSSHFIRAENVPAIPALGLPDGWADGDLARAGFTQTEFTVWRVDGDHARCLAFDISGAQPGLAGGGP